MGMHGQQLSIGAAFPTVVTHVQWYSAVYFTSYETQDHSPQVPRRERSVHHHISDQEDDARVSVCQIASQMHTHLECRYVKQESLYSYRCQYMQFLSLRIMEPE